MLSALLTMKLITLPTPGYVPAIFQGHHCKVCKKPHLLGNFLKLYNYSTFLNQGMIAVVC